MNEPKLVTIVVYHGEKYSDGFPHYEWSALEVLNWFSEKVAQIPAEHMASSRIYFDSESGYEESHYPTISITYSRPETDEEIAKRLREVEKEARNLELREREMLVKLQQKYGSQTT